MKAPSVRWTKHLQPNEAEDFKTVLHNSTYILRRLKDILKEDLDILEKADTNTSDFDNPNWTYRQAARIGEKASLRKTLELLEFLD